ncbi:MAG: methionyl-tRNA formyltransferase [Fuerstiella sp.]
MRLQTGCSRNVPTRSYPGNLQSSMNVTGDIAVSGTACHKDRNVSLKIVLMGTGEFALPTFKVLIESSKHQVVGVYTQPERTGKGHHRHVNPVKVLAEDHGIPVFQPAKVNSPEALLELQNLNADVFIVAAYGQIMKPAFLAIPRLGAFNLHGSILPRHRGAAPVQYSIWTGDQLAGVTIFQIEPSLDSGPIVGLVTTEIGAKETSGELMLRLADLSVELALEVVDQLDAGTAIFQPQDQSQVTLSPKIPKEAGVIDWSQSAEQIGCHVRAMQPWPKASAVLQAEGRKPLRCIFLDVDFIKDHQVIGELGPHAGSGKIKLANKRLYVAASSGWLQVNLIQPDGKKPMDGTAFANGYGVTDGAYFSAD